MQPYPCICKEVVSGFELMTNRSPRFNFIAVSGLALYLYKYRYKKYLVNIFITEMVMVGIGAFMHIMQAW